LTVYSDAAKRLSDLMNLHAVFGSTGKWVAIRLSDGGSDGVTYDTRDDAVSHQFHESLCAYAKVLPGGMQLREAEEFLSAFRAVYDAGMRVHGPEDHVPALPIRKESVASMLRSL
jgi:hypothetical protein